MNYFEPDFEYDAGESFERAERHREHVDETLGTDEDQPVETRRHHPNCPAVDGFGCHCDGVHLTD